VAIVKLDRVENEVNWPAGEPIPQSLKQALKLGWEVSGGSGDGPDDFTEIGEAWLHKTVEGIALHLTVPYRSKIKYGKPHTPRARVTNTRYFNLAGRCVTELSADGENGMVN